MGQAQPDFATPAWAVKEGKEKKSVEWEIFLVRSNNSNPGTWSEHPVGLVSMTVLRGENFNAVAEDHFSLNYH